MVYFSAVAGDSGKRLDAFLHEKLPQYSRSRIQSWIKEGRALVNQSPAKSAYVLHGTEAIEVEPRELTPLRAVAEDIPLEVLYEDGAVVVINKPAGMVVHAGAGNHTGTLVNALVHRFQALSSLGGDLRPGIVHRLDRYTSGILLVARTDEAHQALALQFATRTVNKIYLGLVEGKLEGSGRIEKPITRDLHNRARMTARLQTGRASLTDWLSVESYPAHTFLRIRIGTGRTHQIRAHMAAIGHPVAGDWLYGAKKTEHGRFFLHAAELTFHSPATGADVCVSCPLPVELDLWKSGLAPSVKTIE